MTARAYAPTAEVPEVNVIAIGVTSGVLVVDADGDWAVDTGATVEPDGFLGVDNLEDAAVDTTAADGFAIRVGRDIHAVGYSWAEPGVALVLPPAPIYALAQGLITTVVPIPAVNVAFAAASPAQSLSSSLAFVPVGAVGVAFSAANPTQTLAAGLSFSGSTTRGARITFAELNVGGSGGGVSVDLPPATIYVLAGGFIGTAADDDADRRGARITHAELEAP